MKEHRIFDVKNGSIASELGICKNDILLSVNNKEIIDFLDYQIEILGEYIELEIFSGDQITIYEVEKDHDEDIGLEFETNLMDKPRNCQNNCIFCFIDQLPDRMRKTLYFKDDDIRMSFLNGNYVTLTNIDNKELMRIIGHRLSPINISIHSTDPETRKLLLGNKKAGDILKKIKILLDNDIEVNAQFVVVKGINDGEDLKNSLQDLLVLDHQINSISIVPVGLTKHREGSKRLLPIERDDAKELIDIVDIYRTKFLTKFGKNSIYASDEIYVKADIEVPNVDYYEDFSQIENGVGLARNFIDGFLNKVAENKEHKVNKTYSIVTGESFYYYIVNLIDLIDNNKIKVHKIKNRYFGESVTVAGLLTYTDIVKQLSDEELNEIILIPREMIKQNEDLTLDDHTIQEFKDALDREVLVIDCDPAILYETLVKTNKGEI